MEVWNIISFILFILFVVFLTINYNTLVTLNIDTEDKLKKISDEFFKKIELIPELLNVIKKYIKKESDIFDNAMAIKNDLLTSDTIQEKNENNTKLVSITNKIFNLYLIYPDLKDDAKYQKIYHEFQNIENTIEKYGQNYNKSVNEYNLKIKTFPISFVAKLFSFEKKNSYECKEKLIKI